MNEQADLKNSEPEGRTVDHSKVVMSQVIMPVHTGPGGVYVHGGEIIKLMDTAAGLAALRHAHHPVVTLRVEGINFHHPIRVGNYVTVRAKLTYASRFSMEIQVEVFTEDVRKEKEWKALTAYFVFVALDSNAQPQRVPPLIITSDEERRSFESGESRHTTCRIDEHTRTLCALD